MKRISLVTWVDLTDGHEYIPGEVFPHDGRKIPDERLMELQSDTNQVGYPLIAEIKESNNGKKRGKDKDDET